MKKIINLTKKFTVAFLLLVTITTVFPLGLLNNAVEAAPASKRQAVVNTAYRYRGRPYVFGATGPRTFDCSGFVRYVYRQHGIYLPRTAAAQSRVGTLVSRNNRALGDIVFFRNTYKRGISHVGIYVGNNRIIHAFPRKGVTVDSLSNSYLRAKYAYTKRVLR
ncbi:MAG: C40 family peptidase [Firmicutes bacterium]|nr:C40 family peptidase [Bacillota bacterium]